MILLKEIVGIFDSIAPNSLQESYDNSGILVGNPNSIVTKALLSLDCVESVVDEAIEKNCDLIVAHHPIVFKGLKSLTGRNYVERTVIKAIQNNIAIFACHTNLDNVLQYGVNQKIAKKLELSNIKILDPKKQQVIKLIVYCPEKYAEKIRQTLFESGAGNIGNYSHCSFNSNGLGTFMGNQSAQPFAGKIGVEHKEAETKIEVVVNAYQLHSVVNSLKTAHPYEEVAYDVFENQINNSNFGSGVVGELEQELSQHEFLGWLKKKMETGPIAYTKSNKEKIKTVAVCGGSGSFLIPVARGMADAFVTADIKYHDFFEAEENLMLCDIGHFESEKFTIEIFKEVLSEKLPNFAAIFSTNNSNPRYWYL